MPIADELNILSKLDKRVLDLALLARSEIIRRGIELAKISVNVSAKRIASPDLLDEIRNRDDIPKGGLAFEILETAFFDSINDDMRAQIDGLRKCGISIEVDDFGTGHASFASVLALKPDVLKFDRMFVPGIDQDQSKRELMKGLIQIARNVHAQIVVEGVETMSEVQILAELGVDLLQGYALGYPMRIDDFLDWATSYCHQKTLAQ